MKKNNIIKYIILVLFVIMISLCLFDNNKKNRENYLPIMRNLKNLRPNPENN